MLSPTLLQIVWKPQLWRHHNMSEIRHYLITGDGIWGLSNNFYKHTHAIITPESEKRLSTMLATGMSKYLKLLVCGIYCCNRKRSFSYLTTPHVTGIRRSVVLYCGNGKTEPKRRTSHAGERTTNTDDNRAGSADNLIKNSPSCVGSEKFFSTVVSYEKYNFRLFHCVQPTKINTFCTFFRRQWLSSEWVLPQRYVCWRKWHLFMSMRCWSDRQKLWNK